MRIADIQSSPVRQDYCEETEQEILTTLNQRQLSLRELLNVIGILLIDIGGSLEGVQEGLLIEEMWRRYSLDPSLGNALMAHGADIISDWIKLAKPEEGLREQGEKK